MKNMLESIGTNGIHEDKVEITLVSFYSNLEVREDLQKDLAPLAAELYKQNELIILGCLNEPEV